MRSIQNRREKEKEKESQFELCKAIQKPIIRLLAPRVDSDKPVLALSYAKVSCGRLFLLQSLRRKRERDREKEIDS